ncbi:MAG TPA: hypothetical protein VFN85_09860 [Solirubrobacterales bacterium]|nr:hypothetical protein [Solirubrobacterales bacterium]
MSMVVSLFLALTAMVIGYAAFGQGGGAASLVFFGVLLIGALIRIVTPSNPQA